MVYARTISLWMLIYAGANQPRFFKIHMIYYLIISIWVFLTTSLTKPCKVNSNFLAKIFSDVVQRLVFEPFSPASPISVKNLSGIQMWRRCAWTRIFKWTLKKKSKNICTIYISQFRIFEKRLASRWREVYSFWAIWGL